VQWTRPFCIKRIRESAETGYTMAIGNIRVLLRRDACLVNATPVCRLYREIGLQFCNKLSERRVKAQLRKNRPHRGQADLEYVLSGISAYETEGAC
jgi:hypothetical protein